MASNFRIFSDQKGENHHLKLVGDFDGTSAYELIHALEKYNGNAGKVFIHTCALSCVHPFGLEVFQKNCSMKKLSQSLTFTGKYGETIALQDSNSLS